MTASSDDSGTSGGRWLARAQRLARLVNDAVEWKIAQEQRAEARRVRARRAARRRRRQRAASRAVLVSRLVRGWRR